MIVFRQEFYAIYERGFEKNSTARDARVSSKKPYLLKTATTDLKISTKYLNLKLFYGYIYLLKKLLEKGFQNTAQNQLLKNIFKN
jgi:hypothetical protein